MPEVRTRGRDGARLTNRLVVLIGALFGLFTMHGLGDHGTVPHEMHAAAPHADHGQDRSYTERSELSPAVAPAPDTPAPGMWMAGLCLAVLVGALIAFLAPFWRRSRAVRRPVAVAFVASRPSGRRDRDPPLLSQLSVLRI